MRERAAVAFGFGAAVGATGALLLAVQVAATLAQEMRVAREMEHRQWRAFAGRQVRGGRRWPGADRIGVN